LGEEGLGGGNRICHEWEERFGDERRVREAADEN
jgi:hypothetical protein